MLKRNLLIIFPMAVAIIFSILAIYAYGVNNLEFGDTQDYINAANAFLNGTPYPRESIQHPMFRPPLFPLFIAAIWSIFPDSTLAVKLAQALLHAATVFIAFKIIYELTSKEIPAFLGALLCAVHPLLAGHTVDFYTEPLHTFLCALAMFWLIKFLKSDKSLNLYAVLTGITFGLATLCRPAILGVAICLVAVIVLIQFVELRKLKYLSASALLIASIFLTIAPWTYYNYRTTGEFILVNDGFSYNLWLGNLPETIQLYEGGFQSKEENQRFADHVWGTVKIEKVNELEKTDNYSSLSFNEKEKVWRREALENLKQDYGLTARLMIGKTWSFWTPFLNHFTYGKKVVALVAAFVIGIYVFGIYGASVIWKDNLGRKFVILLVVTFLVTTAIHVLIFGFVRYRVPNVDPYLSMLTGIAIWHLAAKFIPRLNSIEPDL